MKRSTTTTITNPKSQKLLERLESISIVPSWEVLELEDYAEIELKYLLGNLHTAEELERIERFAEDKSSDDTTATDAEIASDEKIRQRFSTFSLISEHISSIDDARADALKNILNEEKMRSSVDLEKRRSQIQRAVILLPRENYRRTIAAFRRIKQRLENIKHFCPSLYYCKDDIFTIWGNMMQFSRKFKNI